MALTPEHKAKISAAVKARYEADPTYRKRVSENTKGATAAHYARIRDENAALRVEVETLRAEVAHLRGER